MNTTNHVFVLLLALPMLVCSCSSGSSEQAASTDVAEVLDPAPMEELPVYGNLLTITTEQMDLQLPAEIPSGLTTVRYENNSTMTHFVLFEKMPMVDGVQKDLQNTKEEVGPVFGKGMDLINQGKMDEAMAAFGELPAWYSQIEYSGGIGLTGPSSVTQATFNLQPGTYTLECYVKSNGKFHSVDGMVAKLVVTDSGVETEAALPESDVVIDVNEDGFLIKGTPTAGLQTFRVNYNHQQVHENFVLHDVNVVRLEPDTNPNEIQFWINWLDPAAFQTPAPATFIGGLQEMSAGRSGLFTVRLQPGEYALIAEVPNSNQKGMFKTFTVTSPGVAGN